MTLQNPSLCEIGCVARHFHLLFRAANESWLSVSRERTTFNTNRSTVLLLSIPFKIEHSFECGALHQVSSG